jgi:general secretion pathway protein A
MYLDYWKLDRLPFDERIDPKCFFASGVHRGIRLHMRTVVEQRKLMALLVGGPGSGKSTAAASLSDSFRECHPAITLAVTPTTARDTLLALVDELQQLESCNAAPCSTEKHAASPITRSTGPIPRNDVECSDVVQLLRGRLEVRRQAGQHVVAFLDAADQLPDRELRKLTGALRELAGDHTPALTVFVIGSPELLVRIRYLSPGGDPLFPQCILSAMAPADSALYVRHRIQRAGGDPGIFLPDSLELIHDVCTGIPRRINRLCDLCLLVGYSKNCEAISDGLVWTAQREMSVLASSRTAVDAPTRRWRPMRRNFSLQ